MISVFVLCSCPLGTTWCCFTDKWLLHMMWNIVQQSTAVYNKYIHPTPEPYICSMQCSLTLGCFKSDNLWEGKMLQNKAVWRSGSFEVEMSRFGFQAENFKTLLCLKMLIDGKRWIQSTIGELEMIHYSPTSKSRTHFKTQISAKISFWVHGGATPSVMFFWLGLVWLVECT